VTHRKSWQKHYKKRFRLYLTDDAGEDAAITIDRWEEQSSELEITLVGSTGPLVRDRIVESTEGRLVTAYQRRSSMFALRGGSASQGGEMLNPDVMSSCFTASEVL
jgi:hypothetical protein